MLTMIAFAVDVGYMNLTRTQLQAAADSAALAAASVSYEDRSTIESVAKTYAGYHYAGGHKVQLNSADIEFGTWDSANRKFIPSTSLGTAIRVTAKTSANNGGATPLFFARIVGHSSQNQSASAVAAVNPRDICFVVDLSRSMNYDTTPGQSSSTQALIQNVYDDFNFGPYPGQSQYAGQSVGISDTSTWADSLVSKTTVNGRTTYGPLWGKDSRYPINSRYKVTDSDSSALKTWKANAYVMEVQCAALMPNAVPALNAGTSGNTNGANYKYWQSYISSNHSTLGYLNYVKFMMDKARDGTVSNYHTPLSLQSELATCPMHTFTVKGEPFSFPPREMPTHAARRALIAAIQVIRDHNTANTDINQKDWVSVITFDSGTSQQTVWSLTNKDNYAGAMDKCRLFQAAGSTGTEAGLNLAYTHLQQFGRTNANKIIVLLTDGQPNDKRSTVSQSAVDNFRYKNPSVWINPQTGMPVNNWFTSGSYSLEKNAALMQISSMQSDQWYVFAAGIGGDCDYDFMDRVARMGGTADKNGLAARGSDNSNEYEDRLRAIFTDIITNPKLRLVH
jgi:hypothetical protein